MKKRAIAMLIMIFLISIIAVPNDSVQATTIDKQRIIDWVRDLQKPDGRFEDSLTTPPWSYSISKTFWGVMTMNALGSQPNEVQSCINWIKSLQKPDGGFYSLEAFPNPVETTYMSVLSLLALGSDIPNRQMVLDFMLNHAHEGGWYLDGQTLWGTFCVVMTLHNMGVNIPDRQAAINYILSFRKSDGGFGHDKYFNSSSIWGTYMAVLSLDALGSDIPNKQACVDYIISLQNLDGSFHGDPDLEGLWGVEPTFEAVAALLALDASIPNVDKCIAYLESCQTMEGGFNFGYNLFQGKPYLASTYYSIWVLDALNALSPDFQLILDDNFKEAMPEMDAVYSIKVKSRNGFSAPVSLRVSFSSIELSGGFDSLVLTPPPNGVVSTFLRVSVVSKRITTHQIYIEGMSNSLYHKTTASLKVPFMTVPYLSQGDTGWCFPTALAMAMNFYGKNLKPWDIATYMNLDHDSGPSWLVAVLTVQMFVPQYGLGWIQANEVTETSLKSLLSQGPVILPLKESAQSPGGGHVFVVTGYTDEGFYVNNPAGGIQKLFSWAELSTYLIKPFGLPNAICITGSVSKPSIGILNLVGGKNAGLRTIKTYHSGVPGPYIWESGASSLIGETKGITWQYGSHQRSLDPFDKLYISEGLIKTLDGLVVNPTNKGRLYQIQLVMESPHHSYSRYENIYVPACWASSPSFNPIDLKDALRNYYGTYVVTLKLLDDRGVLLDQISLPSISYSPFIQYTLRSPANLYVTDPIGRAIGTDSISNQVVSEIPDAFYSGPGSEPQVIRIPNPIDGKYAFQVIGTGNGEFSVEVQTVTFEKTVTQTVQGIIMTGVILQYDVQFEGQLLAINSNPIADLKWLSIKIKSLSDDCFNPRISSPSNIKKVLSNKIDEIVTKIKVGSYSEAIDKLCKDLRPKIDGSPAPPDWIIDAATQFRLLLIIDHVAAGITELQKPV